MQRKNSKAFRVNNSSSNAQKVHKKENPMIKALQKVAIMGGTITYLFTSTTKVWNEDKKEWEPVTTVKWRQHSNINPLVFYKLVDNRSVRRTYEEVLEVFQDISEDMGACYFEIG